MGLKGDYHSLFQGVLAGRDHVWLLLVPPGADAVSGDGDSPLDSGVIEGIVGEMVDVRCSGPRTAMVDRRAVDVPVDLVGLDEFRAGLADHHGARLVAGVAVEIRNVVVPDDVARLKSHVALTAVGHLVAAGVEDAVDPVGPAPDTRLDDAGVHVAFGVSGPDGWEYLQVGLIQKGRPFFQHLHFRRGLDPADAVHQVGTVHDLGFGQQRGHLLPLEGAEIVFLQSDLSSLQAHLFQDVCGPGVRRLSVAVIDLDILDPAVAAGQGRGDLIGHQHRVAVARPDHQHAPGRVGEIQVPGQSPRIGETGQVGEILARTGDHSGDPVLVHELVQAFDVGDDLVCHCGPPGSGIG